MEPAMGMNMAFDRQELKLFDKNGGGLRSSMDDSSDEENRMKANMMTSSDNDDDDDDDATAFQDSLIEPVARHMVPTSEASHVPPLELLSRDSSVMDSNDPLKGTLDIDLRGESDEEYTILEHVDSVRPIDPLQRESISARWNQFSNELQRVQQSKPSEKKSFFMSQSNLNGKPISIGTSVIGRYVDKSQENDAKKDFVNTNKNTLGGQDQSQSYRFIHQTKIFNRFVALSLVLPTRVFNILLRIIHPYTPMTPSPHSQSRIPLALDRQNGEPHQRNFTHSAPVLCSPSRNGQSHLNKNTVPRRDARQPKKPHSSVFNQTTDCGIPVSQAMPLSAMTGVYRYASADRAGMNPNPSSETWNHKNVCTSPTSPRIDILIKVDKPGTQLTSASFVLRRFTVNYVDEKITTLDIASQLTSASGVFRVGLMQQAELVRAHQQFHMRNKHSASDLTLNTRLDTLCPSNPLHPEAGNRLNHALNNRSISLMGTKSASLPQSDRDGRNPWKHDVNPFTRPTQRYTFKDYTLLPQIRSQPKGLGPDLTSDEYRFRLSKYRRQQGYAEILRMHNLKQRIDGPINTPTRPKRRNPRATKSPNGEETLTDRNPSARGTHSLNENPSDDNMALTNTLGTDTPRNTSSPPTMRPRMKHHRSSSSNLATERSEIQSERDVQRREASQKRESMIQYAENIREKLARQRKRVRATRLNDTNPIPIQVKGPNETTFYKQEPVDYGQKLIDPQLDAMLRRHEEDRKQAEAIWKALKISQ